MAPPVHGIYTLGDAEVLLGRKGPYEVLVFGLDRVKDATPVLDIVDSLRGKAGWIVEDLEPLRRLARLDARLDDLRINVLPLLVDDPDNPIALRKLRTHAKAVRRIGRASTAPLRTHAMKLGNRFLKIAQLVLAGKHTGAWLAERRQSMLDHVNQLRKTKYIVLV